MNKFYHLNKKIIMVLTKFFQKFSQLKKFAYNQWKKMFFFFDDDLSEASSNYSEFDDSPESRSFEYDDLSESQSSEYHNFSDTSSKMSEYDDLSDTSPKKSEYHDEIHLFSNRFLDSEKNKEFDNMYVAVGFD